MMFIVLWALSRGCDMLTLNRATHRASAPPSRDKAINLSLLAPYLTVDSNRPSLTHQQTPNISISALDDRFGTMICLMKRKFEDRSHCGSGHCGGKRPNGSSGSISVRYDRLDDVPHRRLNIGPCSATTRQSPYHFWASVRGT